MNTHHCTVGHRYFNMSKQPSSCEQPVIKRQLLIMVTLFDVRLTWTVQRFLDTAVVQVPKYDIHATITYILYMSLYDYISYIAKPEDSTQRF